MMTEKVDQDFVAIVWVDSKLHYLCKTEKDVFDKLILLMDEPLVQVLRPTRTIIYGDEIE
jgi:hypothetical protein